MRTSFEKKGRRVASNEETLENAVSQRVVSSLLFSNSGKGRRKFFESLLISLVNKLYA